MEFTITASMFAQAIVLLSACAGAGASPFPINLTVSDQIGAKRTDEAVCSGVPFARGALQPGDPVHVESGDGVPLVTQTKVLGQWPDGSVKWLLVQFSADCPANKERVYRLVSGEGPESESQLAVRDEDERIVIDTGPLLVNISKTRLAVPGDVRFRNPLKSTFFKGGLFKFVLEDGAVHDTVGSTPEMVVVEEAGPLRATVRVVGWLQGPEQEHSYKLDARLRFYAGQSHVRADYTFICLGSPPLHHVKEISVEFSPELGDTAKFILPGDQEPVTGALTAGQTAVLSADTETVCSVGLDGEQKKAEKHLDGWGLFMGHNASVGVALRDFWHLCPKAIELSTNRIKIALWSAMGEKILNLGRTRAKTHHVLYDFGASEETDRLRAFQEPLIAITDPEYFCTTDALNPLSPAGAVETAEYDQKVEQGFDNLRDQRETMPRENGVLHYGEHYHGG